MRVVLDTNILISSLLSSDGPPAIIYQAWRENRFSLLTCGKQMEEIRRTLRKPAIAARVRPHHAGSLINRLYNRAVDVGRLPEVLRSSDPDDNFILAMAEAGSAHYLVSGDRDGLLVLRRHRKTRILSPRAFALLLA